MKKVLTLLLLITATNFLAQKYNIQNGYLAEGYDVVAYFSNKPVEGKKQYTITYNGVKLKFSSAENLTAFKANPNKYMPQYGGFCAYAIATKKTKMDIDGESYEIRDGKLYLFYNTWFFNQLENWQEEDTPKLQKKGDENWKILKNKKD